MSIRFRGSGLAAARQPHTFVSFAISQGFKSWPSAEFPSGSMPWQPTDFDGIEMKILYKDDEGRSTILFKMAPGAIVPLHEHTALEQTFMLEGSLEDAEGSCGVGDFVWRPGGNIHVAHSPNGATFISVFNRPNRFFDGTKFFTADERK